MRANEGETDYYTDLSLLLWHQQQQQQHTTHTATITATPIITIKITHTSAVTMHKRNTGDSTIYTHTRKWIFSEKLSAHTIS